MANGGFKFLLLTFQYLVGLGIFNFVISMNLSSIVNIENYHRRSSRRDAFGISAGPLGCLLLRKKFMKQQITWTYFVIIFISIILTLLFHEFGHFTLGVISGSQMKMNLIRAVPIVGFHSSVSGFVSSIGGPLFTLLQSFLIAYFLLKYKMIQFYPFLIAGLLARLIPNINVFINYDKIIHEDEPNLSRLMGLPSLTVPLIIISLLIGITFYTSYKLKMSYKIVLITLGSTFISFMIIFRISTLLGF
jgi:hypothetical protein